MAGIFNQSFGGGVAIGTTLADKIQERRDRSKLQELADLARGGLGNADVANRIGAGLIGLGQVGAGINAQNVPYNREQQALQRDFQNMQFQAQQGQQAFQNDIATQRLRMAQEAQARAQQGGGDFTTPFEAVDENGQPVFLQANDRGEVRPIQGFAPAQTRGVKVDTGTHINVVDPRTGVIISSTPKENFQKARDTELGKAQGKSAAAAGGDLERVQGTTERMTRAIDSVLQNPNLDDALGVVQGNLPSIVAGGFGVTGSPQGIQDVRNQIAQITGGAFLQAFESLKGGGQITQIEGEKATQALLAAQTTSSPSEFRRQMKIFKSELEKGVRLAAERNARLNGPQITSDTISNNSNGSISVVPDSEIDDLVRKYSQ